MKGNESESIPETGSISSEPSKPGPRFVRLLVAGEAGLLILAWGLGRWWGISPLERLGLGVDAMLVGVLATAPLLLGLFWVLTSPIGPARQLVRLVMEHVGPLLSGRSAGELAVLALAAGVSEEILFRGVIQVALARTISDGWALLGASLLFGLVHFASPMYALLAGVMGLYLGSLFLLQDSLLAPIVSHTLYDWVALWYVARHASASRPAILEP